MDIESIDRYCDLFEERFRAGEQLSANQFLQEHHLPQDEALLAELRKLEREYRERPYALTAPDPEHAGENRPADLGPAETVGTVIGSYKLLQRIGEGGMGVVYLAEQSQPVVRRVALKIIKPGMDSRQVIARFEAERQALALMDHPNIARVLDAGMTGTGRPYFVMELVKGVPVTQYCDEKHLTPKERLELFIPVCQAVQHAHQKGIIHRDIKPSNILVAEFDDRPVPKIIDFGVAKAISQRLTEKTMFTQYGQIVGTIHYMSPEQASFNQLDVDTRSDIYSLGVLLYELLAGETPFDKGRLRAAAFDELLRIVRQEEPPRPSVRLSSSTALPTIAANRRMEPKKLSLLVRGELDWIVMKALEKDRTRRYETANGLAMDVQRYLADEPVLASPPSATYRIRKFARRHSGAMTAGVLVLLGLTVTAGSIGWSVRDRAARHARAEQERTEQQARLSGQVESILDEVQRLQLQQKWREALAAARRAVSVVAAGEVPREVEAQVRDTVRDLEFVEQLEEIQMMRSKVLFERWGSAGVADAYAKAFREFGVDLDELPVNEAVSRLQEHPDILLALAAALDDYSDARARGDRDPFLVGIARALDPDPLRDRFRAVLGRPASPEDQAELQALANDIDVAKQAPTTLVMIADKLSRIGLDDTGQSLLRQAQLHYPDDYWINIRLATRAMLSNDDEGAIRFCTAAIASRPSANAAYNDLGVRLYHLNRLDEAEAAFRRAIELDSNFAFAHNNLGIVLREQNRVDEAEAAFRRSIECDPHYRWAHDNLVYLLREQDRPDEAEAAARLATEFSAKPGGWISHNQSSFLHAVEVREWLKQIEESIEWSGNTNNGEFDPDDENLK